VDSKKILVVDDDASTRRLIADIIEIMGHDVKVASSGEEAISLCMYEDFDIITTDLNMGNGKMNGVAMAKTIVEDLGKRLKIILVTGSGISVEDAGHYISLIVAKPFRAEEMQFAISAVGALR